MPTVSSQFATKLERAGGAIIVARVDVWRAVAGEWRFIQDFRFNRATLSAERINGTLESGVYRCVFQSIVTENLNGDFDLRLSLDDAEIFAQAGNVNTSANANDTKVFKGEFDLKVA